MDGNLLASTLQDIRLWRVSDGQLVRRIQAPTPWTVGAAFSSNGDVLATANGASVCLWRVQDGSLIRTLRAPSGSLTALAYAGGIVIGGMFDPNEPFKHPGGLALWRADDGKLLRYYRSTSGVWSVDSSADSRLIAYGLTEGISGLARNPL